MVVMRMRIRPHCTIDLRLLRQLNYAELECRQGIKLGKMSTTLVRLRSTINITGRLHFPKHEDDCIILEAYPLRAWLQVGTWTHGHGMYMCRLSTLLD